MIPEIPDLRDVPDRESVLFLDHVSALERDEADATWHHRAGESSRNGVGLD